MATIFTRIAKGEIPSYKCAENEDFYAFLDIAPLAKGHTLVIPKNVEDDYLFHLDEKTYEGLMKFAREVAIALKKAVRASASASPSSGWKSRTRTSTSSPCRRRATWISGRPSSASPRKEMKQIADSILEAYENR
jgi:Diadenosine tetraphosphate (Ap4A) hydrolase and other HIT family hydrolases